MPTDTPTLLAELDRWAEQGWLRRLDSAMARFVCTWPTPGCGQPHAKPPPPAGAQAQLFHPAIFDPPTSGLSALAMATALLAHLEGRGHTCVPLAALVAPPRALLGWPAPALAALQAQWVGLPGTPAAWAQALLASPLVRDARLDHLPPAQPFGLPSSLSPDLAPALAPDAGQPLVLGGSDAAPLLYLRRHWLCESQVVQAVARATAAPLAVDAAAARGWLDTLLGPPEGGAFDWQRAACALALRGRLTLITGGPGTGKTYTAARLLALLLALHAGPGPLRVALAAPTGKAAARLRQAIDQSLLGLQARLGAALDLDSLVTRMGPARTLHALLGARVGTRQFRHHAAHPLDLDVLIVDETSMVNLELMAALLQALPASARLVVLGDKDQLASVEAGAVLGDLCAQAEQVRYSPDTLAYLQATCGNGPGEASMVASHPPLAQHTAMLRESRRFGTTIGQLAQAVNTGDATAAARLLAHSSGSGAVWAVAAGPEAVVALALHGREHAPACATDYLRLVRQGPPAAEPATKATADPATEAIDALASAASTLATDAHPLHTAWVREVLRAWEGFRILCAVHDGPWGDRALNQAVQRALAQAGWLQPQGEWFVGRPVMVTRNDAGLGVFNGDVGVVLPAASGGALRAHFLDGERVRSVSVSRLAHVETAFAMTVHKSQGSEFAHTVLVLPPGAGAGLTRELAYTGITRARTHFSLVEAEAGLLATAIGQRVVRTSGLQARLGLG
jgi:exodeoxyribonuclease V alpha subunit